MDQLGLKDSSRGNQLDCIISYFFQLHLMFHACVRKLDLTGIVQTNLGTKPCLSCATLPEFLHFHGYTVPKLVWQRNLGNDPAEQSSRLASISQCRVDWQITPCIG